MKNRAAFTLLIFLLLLSSTSPVYAEDIKGRVLDLSVPDSPAFSVLGLTPGTVIRPNSPREFATALLNGVDPNGNFQTGVAIDFSPYFAAYGSHIQLENWNGPRHYMTRFFSRAQVSLATTKGANDNDKAARVSAGLHLILFDKGDRRGDEAFRAELSKVATETARRFPIDSIDREANELQNARLKEAVAADAKPVRERYARKYWNASNAVIGFAPTWISRSGTKDTLASNGGAAWASLAYGFDGVPGLNENAQVILHARYRSKENVPVPNKANEYFIQDTTIVGAQARLGNGTTVGSFELAYQHSKPQGKTGDDYLRITVGAEKRLADNLWLQFGAGGESGRRDNTNHLLLLTSLKWAFAQKTSN